MASRGEGILKGVFVIQCSAHTSPSERPPLATPVMFFHSSRCELSCGGGQDTVLVPTSRHSLPVPGADQTERVGMEMKAGLPAVASAEQGVKWRMGEKVAGDEATSD